VSGSDDIISRCDSIKRLSRARTTTMHSYIGTGYPVMFFNMASRGGGWYDALHRGVVDARPAHVQVPVQHQAVRRPTRHYIADILDLHDDDDEDDDEAIRSSRKTNSIPVKRGVWTSLSPSPPSLSSNADDVTTSPGSEQPSAEDLRLTATSCRHHSAGSDSCTSDTPPSDVDVDYMSDHCTCNYTSNVLLAARQPFWQAGIYSP